MVAYAAPRQTSWSSFVGEVQGHTRASGSKPLVKKGIPAQPGPWPPHMTLPVWVTVTLLQVICSVHMHNLV